jgi:hypothetical protein
MYNQTLFRTYIVWTIDFLSLERVDLTRLIHWMMGVSCLIFNVIFEVFDFGVLVLITSNTHGQEISCPHSSLKTSYKCQIPFKAPFSFKINAKSSRLTHVYHKVPITRFLALLIVVGLYILKKAHICLFAIFQEAHVIFRYNCLNF